MNIKQIKKKLGSYDSGMYRILEEDGNLRTGDVVRLQTKDFQQILKNYNLLKDLLINYRKNPKYRSSLWAILNKPCDMVGSEIQRFKSSSLFLAPLQSFKNELKKGGIFSEYVRTPVKLESKEDVLRRLFEGYLNTESQKLFPVKDNLPEENIQKKDEFKKIQLNWADIQVFPNIKSIQKLEETEIALQTYKSSIKPDVDNYFLKFISEISNNKKWKKYKDDYNVKTKRDPDEIHLLGGDNPDKLSDKVFNNQMDSQGRFYYSPNIKLYNSDVADFSYVIELEDLLTLKLSMNSIESGSIVSFLKSKRVVGLDRNYSDRLQNIMGYYYSKIGTKDIHGKPILSLYSTCFDYFKVALT